MRTRFLGLLVVTLAAPAAMISVFAGGCGGGGGSNGATSPSSSTSPGKPGSADAALVPPPVDASPVVLGDAHQPDAHDGNIWNPVLTTATDAGAETAAGPCWKGFTPTGVAEADVVELGHRCASGMSQLVPPVKHTFKQGEAKSIPVAIVPGCYRVIAVGGKGVKDVDLELKDQAGKIVAADKTPDDIMPMIHPNKEFCAEAVQFLNLVISVKKGSGDVAGGVWKR
jgi:hypothetical protein